MSECAICRMQRCPPGSHWAWHDYCRSELNPIALVGVLDLMPRTDEVAQIRRYVIAVTGMDVDAARAAIAAER